MTACDCGIVTCCNIGIRVTSFKSVNFDAHSTLTYTDQLPKLKILTRKGRDLWCCTLPPLRLDQWHVHLIHILELSVGEVL